MKIILSILIFTAIMSIGFLCWSFMFVTFDITKWSETARFMYTLCSIPLASIATLAFLTEN